MNEDFYAKSSRLGMEYWDYYRTYEEQKDNRKEAETIQEALLQLEESKKKYPENSILRSRFDEQIKKLKVQTSIVVNIEEKFKNVKQELLELTATSFEIDPKK